MSHGIMEHDKGFISGTTWHGMLQYIQLPKGVGVTIDQAEEVFNYPLEKVPLFRKDKDGNWIKEPSFSIIRPDKDVTLHSGVGERFTVESNMNMLRRIDEFILAEYKDLYIESVGTLGNGKVAFLNLRVNEHVVKGDKSPTETNLMYCNPLGRSYLAYAHSIRVVCSNTLTISEVQGAVNQTLRKFSHTRNAGTKIQDHLIDLSKVFMELQKHQENLNRMAEIPLDGSTVNGFLDAFFSLQDAKGKTKEGRGFTVARNAREKVSTILEKQKETMTAETAFSRYGLLQAFTDYIDHYGVQRESTDNAAVTWDGITGKRAGDKSKAFEYLLN